MACHGRLPQKLHCGRQTCSYSWQRAHHGCPALGHMPERAGGALWPAKHACLLLCSSRPRLVRLVEDSMRMQAKARSSSDFFDRETEQSLLLAELKQSPETVLVMVGPRSSGKSRLLEEVLLGKKKHEILVAFVDGRDQRLTDAGIMAGVLREQGAGLVRMLKTMGTLAEAASGTTIRLTPDVDLKSLAPALAAALKLFENSTSCSLNDVIAAYGSLLNLSKPRIKQNAPLPVICIDEANVLMDWYKGGAGMEADLNALLHFFVKMTKQSHRAHVILATSEYSFITWLTEKLGDQFIRTVVIGDFPEAEARLFLEQNMGSSITDDEWAGIFEVCGGNAGYLRRASKEYAVLKVWTRGKLSCAPLICTPHHATVLKEIWRNPMNSVVSGLTGGFPWATVQYRTMLRLITESEHGAIIALDAYLELDPSGKQAVQAMVKANLLSYRPASEWAKDIPGEAFGPDELAVVTAPSSAHLYCMRRLLQNGSLSSTAQAASSPPPAASESSPLEQQLRDVEQQLRDVEQQLRDVEQQLQDVAKKIDELETEINDLRSTKPEDWQDEVNYMRDEKKQLREKEKQLREKEKQLRDEKLLLLGKSKTL